MFGIGFPELIVIAFLAILVFGPDKLPDLARQAGRFVRQLRQFANNARDELRSELGPENADLELTDLDPRALVRKHLAEAMAELDEIDDAIRNAGEDDQPSSLPHAPGARPGLTSSSRRSRGGAGRAGSARLGPSGPGCPRPSPPVHNWSDRARLGTKPQHKSVWPLQNLPNRRLV